MPNLGLDVLFNVNHLARLMGGFLVTVKISAVTLLASYFLGLIVGILRVRAGAFVKTLLRFYLECFRIIPVLVWLYLFYYFLPTNFGINLSAFWVAFIVFSLWGGAEMSDIVRGAIISLPKHQFESGLALGLSRGQLFRLIILPQAAPRVTPGAVNLAARMIMTTALLFMLGVVELIKVGQQIIESVYLTNPWASLWIYGFIFLLYFLLCYPLSKFATYLSTRTKAA